MNPLTWLGLGVLGFVGYMAYKNNTFAVGDQVVANFNRQIPGAAGATPPGTQVTMTITSVAGDQLAGTVTAVQIPGQTITPLPVGIPNQTVAKADVVRKL